MKTLKVLLAVVLLMGCRVTEGVAGGVNPGDDMAAVTALLGEPNGHIRAGATEWYFYDRGEVRMRDGKVISAELVSEEEAQAIKAERELQRQERARLLGEHQERLRKEGESLLAEKLADTEFARLPASERLAFWKTFRSRFPGLDVASHYEAALAEAQRDSEQQRLQQQVADMERRVSEAEARTRRAEQVAEEARSAQLTRTYILYPSFSSGSNPVHSGPVHRSNRRPGYPGAPGSYGQPPCAAPARGSGPIIRYDNGSMHGSIYGGAYDFGTFYGPVSGSAFITLP